MKCQEDHETIWESQPSYNHYSVGNFLSLYSSLLIPIRDLPGNSKQKLYKEVFHNIRGDEKKYHNSSKGRW